MIYRLLFILFFSNLSIQAQTYTSYFTGDTSDVMPIPSSGVCIMGGATENDNAMKWFLQKANGGDVVVIRVTGSDGYNAYMYSQLGITVNSVETIVIPSVAAANDAYVRKQLRNAEAIWVAGGNQWNYVNYWKNSAVDSAINYLINTKQGVVGGTSAGMAIMGEAYYSAMNNSVTSAAALQNPYNADITLGYNDFIFNPTLKGVITDTHFDNPDRKGRAVTFLARCIKDYNHPFMAIACEEYTAVCIGNDMKAYVYGDYPANDDNAYFIVPDSCLNNNNNQAETCLSGQPLHWVRNNEAIKTYAVKGTSTGTNYFDLNTKKSGNGGVWKNWYVNNGALVQDTLGSAPCKPNAIEDIRLDELSIYPNPCGDFMSIHGLKKPSVMKLYTITGIPVLNLLVRHSLQEINLTSLAPGLYYAEIEGMKMKLLKR